MGVIGMLASLGVAAETCASVPELSLGIEAALESEKVEVAYHMTGELESAIGCGDVLEPEDIAAMLMLAGRVYDEMGSEDDRDAMTRASDRTRHPSEDPSEATSRIDLTPPPARRDDIRVGGRPYSPSDRLQAGVQVVQVVRRGRAVGGVIVRLEEHEQRPVHLALPPPPPWGTKVRLAAIPVLAGGAALVGAGLWQHGLIEPGTIEAEPLDNYYSQVVYPRLWAGGSLLGVGTAMVVSGTWNVGHVRKKRLEARRGARQGR